MTRSDPAEQQEQQPVDALKADALLSFKPLGRSLSIEDLPHEFSRMQACLAKPLTRNAGTSPFQPAGLVGEPRRGWRRLQSGRSCARTYSLILSSGAPPALAMK